MLVAGPVVAQAMLELSDSGRQVTVATLVDDVDRLPGMRVMKAQPVLNLRVGRRRTRLRRRARQHQHAEKRRYRDPFDWLQQSLSHPGLYRFKSASNVLFSQQNGSRCSRMVRDDSTSR